MIIIYNDRKVPNISIYSLFSAKNITQVRISPGLLLGLEYFRITYF